MRERSAIRPGTGIGRPGAALVVCLLVAAALLLVVAGAEAATERIKPVGKSARALIFAVDDVAGKPISRARVVIRGRRSKIRRKIDATEIRDAPDGRLRVRKPRPAKKGTLVLTTTEPAPAGGTPTSPGGSEPAPTGSGGGSGSTACDPGALAQLTISDCLEAFSDAGTAVDPATLWGKTDCATAGRHRLVDQGGDSHATAHGVPATDSSHRELRVIDGDDVWGERCELGKNWHTDGPTALFREGDRAVTFVSFRLGPSYPLEDGRWQVIMQMKQTQPSANGGGTPVISFEAKGGRWRLLQSTSSGPSSDTRELWTTPAARGQWARFAFDVTYSQDPGVGAIQVSADTNGDGDAADPGERSPRIGTYTLKRETEGGSPTDGVAPGESIPSHLRTGVYHHPDIACPPPAGCGIDVDNVQIVRVG